jgi:hypothetical protein
MSKLAMPPRRKKLHSSHELCHICLFRQTRVLEVAVVPAERTAYLPSDVVCSMLISELSAARRGWLAIEWAACLRR